MDVVILILIILAILFVIFVVAVSCNVAAQLAKPNVISLPDEIKFEKERGMWRDYESIPKEEFILKSYDEYELHCTYIPADQASNKYVIITHGYTGCHLGSVKYLHMFREFGFNCMLYDDRTHGENKYTFCTMGFRESRDLMAVIDYVYGRFGKEIILGLHGESMGSALTINALQYKPDVKFIVSDCGYNSLEKLMVRLVKVRLHLPAWFAKCAGLASKIMYGYSFSQVTPIAYLAENEIPICFIHGLEDELIPCEHAKEMHSANKGYSELHLVEGAGHAQCVLTDEISYKLYVRDFLRKVEILYDGAI